MQYAVVRAIHHLEGTYPYLGIPVTFRSIAKEIGTDLYSQKEIDELRDALEALESSKRVLYDQDTGSYLLNKKPVYSTGRGIEQDWEREARDLRARIRRVTQTIIEQVGADGPMALEDAVDSLLNDWTRWRNERQALQETSKRHAE
jgi:hypothetical protein